MNITVSTTRDELIQEIEALRFDLTTKQAECDDWQETATMARTARDGFELAHKDALKRIRLLAANKESLYAQTLKLITELEAIKAFNADGVLVIDADAVDPDDDDGTIAMLDREQS